MSERVIAQHPPSDGRWWECQCARCGSSCDEGQHCWNCGGDGYTGSACIDDLCYGRDHCIHGDDEMLQCDVCEGDGGFPPVCLSDAEWCDAHPLAGREHVERGALEWYVVERPDQ